MVLANNEIGRCLKKSKFRLFRSKNNIDEDQINSEYDHDSEIDVRSKP